MKVMKRRSGYLFWLFILFTGCEKDHLFDCLKSTGAIVMETRPVSDFSRLDVFNNVDVVITQDSVNSIVVEAGSHIVSGITTDITDGVLTIRNENKCNWVRSYERAIVVHVQERNLNAIHHRGSAVVSSSNTLKCPGLDLNVWSAGDIKLSVDVAGMYSRQHSSVGDIILSGRSTHCYIYNNGNGFTYHKELKIQHADIEQRGTGDIYVQVSTRMNVSIHGSGNVYYSGNPQVSSTVTGSGRLIHQ